MTPELVSFDFENAVSLPKEEIRAFISELEERLRGLPQVEIPVSHSFSHKVYGREIPIAKDTLIVGKIHKYAAMNVLLKGEVSVLSQDGAVRLKAPHTFVSSPGAKRVIFAHEDSIWANFHGTELTDPEQIEKEMIAKSYEEVLQELGSSEKEVRAISENPDDQISFPYPPPPVSIRDSEIEGLGLFSDCGFKEGELIAIARIDGKRTPAGRYANHSMYPNAQMVMNLEGQVSLFATKDIGAGEEITTDYFKNYANTRSES